MAVNLTKLSKNVNNIQALDDNPNEGATPLTSSELKEQFDKAGADIKEYLNDSLTTELETIINNTNNTVSNLNTTFSSEIGDVSSLTTTDKSNLVNAINELLTKINGTVLYNNASGSNGSITLSDSAANYTYLEIFYRTNDNEYSSVKVYQPDGKDVFVFGIRAVNTTPRVYGKTKVIIINGTNMTIKSASTTQFAINNGSASSINDSNQIYITRVVGY